jgi:hypothetical protein
LGETIKIAQVKIILPSKTLKEAFLEKNKSAKGKQHKSSLPAAYWKVCQKHLKLLFGISIYTSDNAIKPMGG